MKRRPAAHSQYVGMLTLSLAACASQHPETNIGSQPSAITGAWATSGTSLSIARSNFTTSRLLPTLGNGDVLVAGGENLNSTVVSATQAYTSSGFTTKNSMATSRAHYAGIALDNGDVLVAGGGVSNGTTTTAQALVERYNSVTQLWEAKAPLNVARYAPAAARLNDGKILLVGGVASGAFNHIASAEVFDPATNTSVATAGNLAAGRSHTVAAVLSNNKVAVIGGSFTETQTSDIYDPVTRLFTAGPALVSPHAFPSAARLPDGRVLVCGGCAGQFCSDPSSNACETFSITGSTATASLPVGAGLHGMLALPTNKILAVGGVSGSTTHATAALYDPVAGTWTPTGSLSQGRYQFGMALLPNGQVLVVGGVYGPTNNTTPLSSAEIYDPGTPVVCKVQQVDGTSTTLANGTVCTGGTCQGGVCVSADAGSDAGSDAAADAPADAPADSPADAGSDAAIDASSDALLATDSASDAASDATTDSGTSDVGTDAPLLDAPTDTTQDVNPVDGGADASSDASPLDAPADTAQASDGSVDSGIRDAAPSAPDAAAPTPDAGSTPPAGDGGCQTSTSTHGSGVSALLVVLGAAFGAARRQKRR